MPTLQIQDVFDPYYSGRILAGDEKTVDVDERDTKGAAKPSSEDRRARFDAVNRRIGRARRPAPSKGN